MNNQYQSNQNYYNYLDQLNDSELSHGDEYLCRQYHELSQEQSSELLEQYLEGYSDRHNCY